jgi:predicted ferric reductase
MAHEITIKSHFALAILAAVMLWLHIPFALSYNTICLIVASSIFIFHLVVFLTRFGVRNFAAWKPLSTAEVIKHEGAVELVISPARPWKVLPGQYVYISAPAVRIRSFADPFTMVRSFMEAHPFTVIWWEEGTDGKAEQFSVLVKAESGFTKALAETTHRQLRLCIDGPYGVSRNFDKYNSIHNSILMIATGVGIAAHIPYVKHLIDSFPSVELNKDQEPRRRIYIVWEVEEECKSLSHTLKTLC